MGTSSVFHPSSLSVSVCKPVLLLKTLIIHLVLPWFVQNGVLDPAKNLGFAEVEQVIEGLRGCRPPGALAITRLIVVDAAAR